MGGLVGGNVKLPSQFAHIAHPMRAAHAKAQLDLSRRAVREGFIAEIVAADAGDQVTRLRPHDAKHQFRRRRIGDDREGIADMASQPMQVALQGRARHHQKEGGFRKPGHGQVAFDAALFH